MLDSHQEEAVRIVSTLTLNEKVALCSGQDMWYLEKVAHLEPIMITDGPHGLRKQLQGEATDLLKGRVEATCFPTASCLACSWDPNLLEQVGVALAHECISENVAVLLGPGMNIKRHVCGGRNFEYFSEDPLLSGSMATALVHGVQSQGVGTSIKHFCVNNQESSRMRVNVIVDERTLREIYWRGFEYLLTKAKVQPTTIMTAYNRLNGVFCSEHESLWNMVREEWGFDGVVVTNWGATNDRVRGILAGVDLEMPGSKGAFDHQLIEAVESGILPKETLNDTVRRNVALSLLGRSVMERVVDVDKKRHHELARKAAMECAILLKNDNHLLPLATNTSVAIIGDFAKKPRYQGMGSSQVNPTQVDCAWDRIQHYTNNLVYAQGYRRDQVDNDIYDDMIQEAVDAAKQADVALVFCGLPEICESEGFDRPHMNMPPMHNSLIDAVCAANPRTVVILSNGAPVSMPWVNNVGAILEGYLAGQGGGSALVDLIFGVESPCGKLAETFPISQEDLASNAYFPGEHDQVQYREHLNVGYRHFDSAKLPVLFPFGHGLSYTEFEYSDLKTHELDGTHGVHVAFTLRNVGTVRAAEIVQCYVHDMETSVYRPEQELKAFTKVWLNPGEQQTVDLTLDKDAFAFYDVGHKTWIVEPGDFEIRVGASSRDVRLTTIVRLAGSHTPSARAHDAHPPYHVHGHQGLITDEAFCRMLGQDNLPLPVTEVRPFHRNTLTHELQHSFPGRFVRKTVLRIVTDEMDDPNDPAQRRMVESLVDHTPLRGLVLFSKGNMRFEDLDVIVHLLNYAFLRAILGIWPCIRRRIRGKR
jgi:beta-glucosidase